MSNFRTVGHYLWRTAALGLNPQSIPCGDIIAAFFKPRSLFAPLLCVPYLDIGAAAGNDNGAAKTCVFTQKRWDAHATLAICVGHGGARVEVALERTTLAAGQGQMLDLVTPLQKVIAGKENNAAVQPSCDDGAPVAKRIAKWRRQDQTPLVIKGAIVFA